MKMTYIRFLEEKQPVVTKLFPIQTIKIKDPESIDERLESLKEQNYDTFLISSQLASFSQDVIKKYEKDKNIKIIILPDDVKKKDIF